MIITLSADAELDRVRRELTGRGLWIASTEKSSEGTTHLVIGRESSESDPRELATIAGVRSVSATASPHPMIDAHGPEVTIGNVTISAKSPVIIAGPCSVESEAQIRRIASLLRERRVKLLRGGAFKPRTSPYSFQGHGPEALRWLRRAADEHGMLVVTEALSEADVPAIAEHADLIQIGSRNMHNYALLKTVGRAAKPVLLKRSMAATIEEWLLAGEYLLAHGAKGIVLCERGIRSFDDSTRNLLDLGAVALLAHVKKLPVVVDPSHATGKRELVLPLAKAAIAAGAAGVMIETHDAPHDALSDGAQALPPGALSSLSTWLDGSMR
jgi:3-deoxy-7-phosphoheptulonate synthase